MGKKTNNLLSWLGIAKRPLWSPSYFVNLLNKRIEEREKKGLSSKYEYVKMIISYLWETWQLALRSLWNFLP
jgi:hypothetical protein